MAGWIAGAICHVEEMTMAQMQSAEAVLMVVDGGGCSEMQRLETTYQRNAIVIVSPHPR